MRPTIRALRRDRSPPLPPTSTRDVASVVYGTDSQGTHRLPAPHVPLRTVWTTAQTIDEMVKASGPPIPTDSELAAQAAALLTPSKETHE